MREDLTAEIPARGPSSAAPSPPRAGPPGPGRSDLNTESGTPRPHMHSEQHTRSRGGERQPAECRRGTPPAPRLGSRGRRRPAVTVRDRCRFGEVVCGGSWTGLLGSARRDFFKGELRRAGQGPMGSCPTGQGRGLRAWFAPTERSWAERSERCTARGFLGPSPAQTAGPRLLRAESSGLCLL